MLINQFVQFETQLDPCWSQKVLILNTYTHELMKQRETPSELSKYFLYNETHYFKLLKLDILAYFQNIFDIDIQV